MPGEYKIPESFCVMLRPKEVTGAVELGDSCRKQRGAITGAHPTLDALAPPRVPAQPCGATKAASERGASRFRREGDRRRSPKVSGLLATFL
jgi:hypothetical protein